MTTATLRNKQRKSPPDLLTDKRNQSNRLPVHISFGYLGVLVGLWGAEIASVKARAGLSAEALGIVLAFLPLGTLAGLRVSRILMARWPHGLILARSAAASTAILVLLINADSDILVSFLLLFFGAAMCQANVAANHYGAMLEVAENRPLMSGLHAFFGYGLALGAGLAYLSHYTTHTNILIATALAALLIPVIFTTCRLGPIPTGNSTASSSHGTVSTEATRPSVLLLGVLSMICALAESGFSDWLGVYLNVHVKTTPTTAALGFTVFASSLTLGRSLGDRITQAIGSMRTLQGGGVMTALGIATLISTENRVLAFAGVILCGLGFSTLSPLITAAAGKINGQEASGLTHVIALSTVGNFAGPPALGAMAAILGLPFAMTITATCGLLVSMNARAVDRQLNATPIYHLIRRAIKKRHRSSPCNRD